MTTKELILQRIEERVKPKKIVRTINAAWITLKGNEKIKPA